MSASKSFPLTWISLAGRGLAVAAAAVLLLGWLSEEVMEGETARFDTAVRTLIHAASSPGLTSAMWFFTILGSTSVSIPIYIATIAAFRIWRWRYAAVTLAVTLAGALLLNLTLKLAFHRPRPAPYFGITPPASFSYPSGHALFSFAFFTSVAVLVTARLSNRRARALVWFAALTVVFLIGYSRIYLGVHYPSDVIAGYLTAFIWIKSVSAMDRLHRRHSAETTYN